MSSLNNHLSVPANGFSDYCIFWDDCLLPNSNPLEQAEYSTGNHIQLWRSEQLKDVEKPQEVIHVEESENALPIPHTQEVNRVEESVNHAEESENALPIPHTQEENPVEESENPIWNIVFATEEDASKFYRDFAGKEGFQVKMGDKRTLKNGSIKRDFWCSRYKSMGKREGSCNARFQITFEKEKWKISVFKFKHNHELSPPRLHTEQADGATSNTEGRKRPNEVPFDKSKTKKHSSHLLGSQKAEQQEVNTPMDHPRRKSDDMNAVETFLHSAFSKKEMSEVQKSTASHTGVMDHLKRGIRENLGNLLELNEKEILRTKAQLKELKAARDTLRKLKELA